MLTEPMFQSQVREYVTDPGLLRVHLGEPVDDPDRRSDKVPNSGLGPKWDQSAKKVPKKSLFCLQVPNFSLISINERIASI